MIVNKYANGGGGSGSGVTPEQVQQQINSALTPYWDSAATESAITEAVEGKADAKILVDFDHTPQSERAALYATLKGLYDGGSGATINKNYDFYKTVNTWQGQKIDYYTFSGDTLVFGQVVSPENTADQVVYAQVMTIDSGGGVNVVTNIVGGGASGETNLNILAAISSQTEYEAITGSVKTGDLIQVQNVDINGDGGEYGLFQADVQEIEDQGVITKEITWNRADSSDSLNWNYKDYPWMTDNDVYPVDLGAGGFLISLAEGGYNGIGFDGDGKAVITHIVPEEDDQTGEVTGMTREDRDILGELDTLDEVVSQALVDLNDRVDEISGATPQIDLSGYTPTSGFSTINGSAITNGGNLVIQSPDMSGYYTSGQTDAAISAALIPFYTSAQTETAISAATQNMVTSTDVRHIVKLTQAAYDQLVLDDDVDPDTFYIIVNNSN